MVGWYVWLWVCIVMCLVEVGMYGYGNMISYYGNMSMITINVNTYEHDHDSKQVNTCDYDIIMISLDSLEGLDYEGQLVIIDVLIICRRLMILSLSLSLSLSLYTYIYIYIYTYIEREI